MSGKKNTRGTDLPEPDWWARCRKMKSEGYSPEQIAKACDKSRGAVDYVLYRERRVERRKLREANRVEPKRSWKHIDHKRMKARAEARTRWRSEQYSKPLDSYYRQLECL